MGAMWKERRGGRWIWKKSYYCFSMQPVWRLKWLSNIIWAGNSQYFKIGWDWDQKWQRQEKEREKERKEGEQACSSEAFHHPPNSCSFPLPSSSSWEREREWATERERESHAYKAAEKRRQEEDLQRKKILLSLLLSLFVHPTGSKERRGVKRTWLADFPRCFPAISVAVTQCVERGESCR